MTSVNQNLGQNDHMLMCKQWWRVCWMYGDQEKFYRQLYGRKNTSRAIVTSTSTTVSNYDNIYSELCNRKVPLNTVNTNSNLIMATESTDTSHIANLERQGAYQELYGLGATMSLKERGDIKEKKPSSGNRKNPSTDPIPTISSSIPTDNTFVGSILNASASGSGKGKPRLFPYPKEMCGNMSVLAVPQETLSDQDTLPRYSGSGKKRTRNVERVSETEATTTTTAMLTFDRQVLTSNQ